MLEKLHFHISLGGQCRFSFPMSVELSVHLYSRAPPHRSASSISHFLHTRNQKVSESAGALVHSWGGNAKTGKKKKKMERQKGQRALQAEGAAATVRPRTCCLCSLRWAFVFMAVNWVTPCLFSLGSMVQALTQHPPVKASVMEMKLCCTRPN